MLMTGWFTAEASRKPRPSRSNLSAFGRVPPGVASDKDQGRLLQGQESPRNVSERSIRLSRILLSTAAGEEVPGTHTVLRLQPSGQSLGAESHALDDPRLGHPTSNTAVVGRCRPADQSPPTRGHQPGAQCHGGASIGSGQDGRRVHLVGGHVAIYFSSLPLALGLVKEGKVRALAVTGAKRSPIFPDLPTVAETAAPGFWGGLRYWVGGAAGAAPPPNTTTCAAFWGGGGA